MFAGIADAVALGFAIAVPIGPVSLLCMHRTLTQGRVAGLATGLGIATADALYAILVVGGFNLSADSRLLEAPWAKWAAGILVLVIGFRILTAPPVKAASSVSDATIRWCAISGFFLTLTNPVAVLLLIAGFAVLGLAESTIDLVRGSLLISGIFIGSMIWWVGLVIGVSIIRRQVSPTILHVANRATGLIFIVFGVVAIAHGFLQG